MSAAVPLVVNGRLMPGHLVPGGRPRLGVPADDWEALGVGRGDRLAVAAPGRPPLAGVVRSDTWVDPGWVWVELDPVAPGGPPARGPRAVRVTRAASR